MSQADTLYNNARALLLQAGLNWLTDVIRVVLIDTTRYTFDPTHQFVTDVSPGAIIFTSPPLSGKSITSDGAATAANLVVDSLTNANPVGALIIYKDTGTPGTSPLLAYIQNYSNLPATLAGGTFTVLWPSDINRIFRP